MQWMFLQEVEVVEPYLYRTINAVALRYCSTPHRRDVKVFDLFHHGHASSVTLNFHVVSSKCGHNAPKKTEIRSQSSSCLVLRGLRLFDLCHGQAPSVILHIHPDSGLLMHRIII